MTAIGTRVAGERRRLARREGTLRALGIVPTVTELLGAALGRAMARAEAGRRAAGGDPGGVGGARDGRAGDGLVVLDAGCGRQSALARFRPRIARFVGVDIHPPAPGALPYLDEFATVDVCADGGAFPPATFDVVLSSFTVEHFADPTAAFANLRRWLRPGGTLVLTTVNRRHPFVAAYLALPNRLRRRSQPLVKATAADAHPLVGACNDPRALRAALRSAGFDEVQVRSVGHLARAWGRHGPTFALGLAGDLLARDFPSRRSTLIAAAIVRDRPAR